MNIYLIDFENVGETSLNGIEDLNSDDKVYIFYSNKITINLFSRAEIGFINTNKPANISENQKRRVEPYAMDMAFRNSLIITIY